MRAAAAASPSARRAPAPARRPAGGALRRALALALAAAASSGGGGGGALAQEAAAAPITHLKSGTWQDQPVCDGPRWTGATAEELLTGAKEPDVQCAREPPCVRWSWVRGRAACGGVARGRRGLRVRRGAAYARARVIGGLRAGARRRNGRRCPGRRADARVRVRVCVCVRRRR
jgi:hypothetical protein